MVPDFIDTDNVPLRMFPVSFLLSFYLLEFIISNRFGILQNIFTPDQATIRRFRHCEVVVFVNLINTFATIFARLSWSTYILYIMHWTTRSKLPCFTRWNVIIAILPRRNMFFWIKIIQVTFKKNIVFALVTNWCSKSWFSNGLQCTVLRNFGKIYQHMLCVLLWLPIICCTEDQFYFFIRNQSSRVTCMDEVCQSIKLHLNHTILVLNNNFFNQVVNFFRIYYTNKIITD